MSYREEMTTAMAWLGHQPDTVFLGQAVACEGTSMTGTLSGVPRHKLVELPVAEDMQLGMCTGMALNGFVPISIYPRFNFLLLATNQLVLHLDRLPIYSEYRPKVIVRTAVASREPLDPQAQHWGDFTIPYRGLLWSMVVNLLSDPEEILPAYQAAYQRTDGRSTLIVERTELYV